MKNFAFVLVFLTIASVLLCSCSFKNKTQTINYQGKLKKYIEIDKSIKKIDLSEGPRLKYEANFGPNDLNFDIKIKNPY